jgi:asparagine synthase (glutamine-hydrolysing)
MLQAQAHRGPDGCGMVDFEGGAAGAVRLALVDPSNRGQQPIWSADRRVAILFNGEMYNHVEERSRLIARGYRFGSSTDTEVVLALYLEHGIKFADYVRGMFALAILDWRESTPGGQPTLLLARDHFGIKPLYITRASTLGNPLVFASEIRSLLASRLIPKEIDKGGLIDYLAVGFVMQPRTIIAGVEMLERGSILRMTPRGLVERARFWNIPRFQAASETFEQSAERLRSILDESIALHSMADAPVGAFLSGGVDSAGVVGLMVRKNPKVRTYSLRLADFAQSDESAQASDFARSVGCQSTVVEVAGKDIPDLVPRFAAEIDQPSVDGLNTWLVSRAAARDVKGVLSGLGGDEWFAGYAATRNLARHASGFGRVYPMAGRIAAFVRQSTPRSYIGRKLEGLSLKAQPWTSWLDCREIFGYELAAELVRDRAAHQNTREDIQRILSYLNVDWQSESPVGLSCLLDVDVYMRCQLLRDSDATSMASSLELRVPFVDVKVAEFSRSCADSYKLHYGGGKGNAYSNSGAKRVLIHALRDVLPAGISRRPKRGFSIPYQFWLKNNLNGLVSETCSKKAIADRGLLDPHLASSLAYDGSARRWSTYPLEWSLMILELWCRAVLDQGEPKREPHQYLHSVVSI